MKFRMKFAPVDAIRWTGANLQEIRAFVGVNKFYMEDFYLHEHNLSISIPTLKGETIARQGDWIIKGLANEYYACDPNIFEQTYEEDINGILERTNGLGII